ncbi:MAG: hypothetical protein IJ121_07555 [Eubacterium sp.]|nr:hypothetical protein [Eubacterium sp.]
MNFADDNDMEAGFWMQIDNNDIALLQDEIGREGRVEEGIRMRDRFIEMVRESGDYCPCKENCTLHGDCFACVQVHRGHRGHLPLCMWDMVNERIADIASLTEGSFRKYMKDHPERVNGAPRGKSQLTVEQYYELFHACSEETER